MTQADEKEEKEGSFQPPMVLMDRMDKVMVKEGENPPLARAWYQVENLVRKRKRRGYQKVYFERDFSY